MLPLKHFISIKRWVFRHGFSVSSYIHTDIRARLSLFVDFSSPTATHIFGALVLFYLKLMYIHLQYTIFTTEHLFSLDNFTYKMLPIIICSTRFAFLVPLWNFSKMSYHFEFCDSCIIHCALNKFRSFDILNGFVCKCACQTRIYTFEHLTNFVCDFDAFGMCLTIFIFALNGMHSIAKWQNHRTFKITCKHFATVSQWNTKKYNCISVSVSVSICIYISISASHCISYIPLSIHINTVCSFLEMAQAWQNTRMHVKETNLFLHTHTRTHLRSSYVSMFISAKAFKRKSRDKISAKLKAIHLFTEHILGSFVSLFVYIYVCV